MASVKATDYLAAFLEVQGVDRVYEVVGGMITHMLDSLHRRGSVRIISVHHEQAAAFAADAHGRIRGRPAVAMGTSGPGATNLLTGIGSCYFDSVPAIFITGQVNRHELKGKRGVRQLGFQETDIVTMAEPITKGAWLVPEAEELPTLLAKAFALAVADRPGPVLLDIPMDVQNSVLADPPVPEDVVSPAQAPPGLRAQLPQSFFTSLAAAERPLVIAGSGAAHTDNRRQVRHMLEQLRVPVVGSLLGCDLLPHGHPLRVGFHGSYGNRWANYAIGRADWLLVIGSRLDIRQTGADTDNFRKDKTIFHVDLDGAEVNNRVPGCHWIEGHLRSFAKAILDAKTTVPNLQLQTWQDEIKERRAAWPAEKEYHSQHAINPCSFLQALSRHTGGRTAAAWLADVGQHQMWAAQCLELTDNQRFLTSGGMGAMGYGLPAAIGACLAVAEKPVILIAGDGGFQLNLQELQTVVRNELPVKIVLFNNQCHGMVRQFQQSYFHERYRSTLWGYSAPDFAAVAKAYGLTARSIDQPSMIPEGLAFFYEEPRKPALLQVMLDPLGNVYPKIAFGHPLTEMEPQAKPIAMEGT